jgi:hypothetical protein
MHNQDNSVLEFNINPERERLTACEKDHLGAATMVSNLPFKQDKESDSSVASHNDVHSYNKATGG